jgi:hypothetical protein
MSILDQSQKSVERFKFVEELIEFFRHEEFEVHGVRNVEGYTMPPTIPNRGYGDNTPRRPDVIGLDTKNHRIVFGIVRVDRESLDTEESLAEYNVFLDHNAHLGEKASIVYVMMPDQLVQEFTNIITHYIHREYWHRIIPVRARAATSFFPETS